MSNKDIKKFKEAARRNVNVVMFDDTESLIRIINACANSKNADGKIESFSVFSHGHR